MIPYCYESDWRPYAFPVEKNAIASDEDLRSRYTEVSLDPDAVLEAGGLMVQSDGVSALINTENEHTLIYGGTASKKTRTLILPLMRTLAQARESMIVMDIKGELSDGVRFPEIRAMLHRNGYDCRFLNLRDLNGDGFNILLEPYRLFRSGERDEGVRMVNDIANALAGIYRGSSADPFWAQTATLYFVTVTILMFAMCPEEARINMLSLASYTDWQGSECMQKVADLLDHENNIMSMLRSVVSEPEKTRMSTLATVSSMMTDFLTNEKLLKMLSTSTFEIPDLYRKPTALFIILPDEVDTYAGIVGLLLQQITAVLVRSAYQEGGVLPRRVNLVCDEFCNYYIPGMTRAISAHRSRNLRWYIVCQSQKQLESCYPKEADTILANCTNLYFLSSPELSLLEYLSRRAGTTRITADGTPEPLISVADLQSLKKGRELTDVYFTSGNLHYFSKMPDISLYPPVAPWIRPRPMPTREFRSPAVYPSSQMLRDARQMRTAWEHKKMGMPLSKSEDKLAKRYETLFSAI